MVNRDMMRRIGIIGGIISLLFLPGCKKEVDQFIPVLDPVDFDFSGEFTEVEDTLIFKIDGTVRTTVTTPIGAEFIVKGEMFEFVNGEYCPCEELEIRILELDKKRDYLVHQTPTVSNDQLLISAGAYHFAAYFKGKPLQMIKDEQLCLVLPASNPDSEMELFYGEKTGERFNWIAADDVPESRAFVKAGEWQTDSSFIVGYQCFSDRLGWINIDKLASEGPENPVLVKLDEFYTGVNTVVFAVLEDEQAILSMYYEEMKQGFGIANLPIGLKVHFVAVHKKDDDLYELGSEEVVITKDHFESLSFEVRSLSEIKSFLKSL